MFAGDFDRLKDSGWSFDTLHNFISRRESDILSVEDLSAGYPNNSVLDSITFAVPRNHVTSIIGSSGSGKTTLLHSLLGLHNYRGKVFILLEESNSFVPFRSHHRSSMTSFAPQKNSFYPDLTIQENLSHFGSLFGRDHKQLMDDFCLEEKKHTIASSASHVTQKLLDLSLAFLPYANLIVLDNPFEQLDGHGKQLLIGKFKSEIARGASILFTTHDKKLAQHLSQRVYSLNDGRLS